MTEVRIVFETTISVRRSVTRRTPPSIVLLAWARRYLARHHLTPIGAPTMYYFDSGVDSQDRDLFAMNLSTFRLEVRAR